MKHLFPAALFALTGLACSGTTEDKGKPNTGKGDVVRLGSKQARAPGEWKQEQPRSKMCAYQFSLPGPKGAAELLIFDSFGGSADANVSRWKKQFTPAEDQKPDDVTRVTRIKVGGYPAQYLDVSGTYESGMPADPGAKENYRMLGVHIDAPGKVYHIILRGPAATVAKYRQGFDDWLKAFK